MLDRVKRALVVSAALHVVLGAALLAIELDPGDALEHPAPSAIAIEVIAPPAPPRDVMGGGSTDRPAAPSPVGAETRERGRAKRAPRVRPSELATYTIDPPRPSVCAGCGGGGRTGEGGEGDGAGGHRGSGIGFGDGGRIEVAAQTFVLPEAPRGELPRPSKARPAKLVYPRKHRDLGADELFVARVTVDTDGYVVGARLVRGRNGPADDEAADLIFRFRYLPALDDDGRAIRSTFEQPFHVGR